MESKDETIKRLQRELDEVEAAKVKNLEKLKRSEDEFKRKVLAEKEIKYKAGLYTVLACLGFLIDPVFCVFITLLLIGFEIYSLFKTEK